MHFHRLLAPASVKLTYVVKGNQHETNQLERAFIENEMSRTSTTLHEYFTQQFFSAYYFPHKIQTLCFFIFLS